HIILFLLTTPTPPKSTLFPYTTLFRFTKNSNTNYCTDEGYVTEWSGGIRLRAGLDYSNVFAGVNMTPNISLSYDKGYGPEPGAQDRKSTRLNSSHVKISYAVFCLKKKN